MTDFDEKLKNSNKKITSNKKDMYLLKMNWKIYRHLTQVFLLVKVILIMIEHNVT